MPPPFGSPVHRAGIAAIQRRLNQLDRLAAGHRGLAFVDFCAVWPHQPGENARLSWLALGASGRQAALAAAPDWLKAAQIARPGSRPMASVYLSQQPWKHNASTAEATS